jgi:signal transduction histidine kinase
VRTPLNGIIGMTTVLLAGELDAQARRNVGLVRSSGFHLLAVINRILDFSKREHEEDQADEVIEFDPRELVEEVVQEARFSGGNDGVIVRIDVDDGVGATFVGWRQGLRQVLTNLVGNAIKFTEAGTVTVSVMEPAAGGLRIEVRDTGIGIPAAARERIFLPFEQGEESTSRRYGGTGLGLSICSEMVRKMGGRIGVESAPGLGSTFWIEVPSSGDAAPDAEALRQAAALEA